MSCLGLALFQESPKWAISKLNMETEWPYFSPPNFKFQVALFLLAFDSFPRQPGGRQSRSQMNVPAARVHALARAYSYGHVEPWDVAVCLMVQQGS